MLSIFIYVFIPEAKNDLEVAYNSCWYLKRCKFCCRTAWAACLREESEEEEMSSQGQTAMVTGLGWSVLWETLPCRDPVF